MRKQINEWKIFFGSMNGPKANVSAMIVFFLNSILCTLRAYQSMQNKTDMYHWTYGIVWLLGCYIFFIRLFFNRSTPRFSKTLPCTKKLYTRNISILFELLNTLNLLIGVIIWIILYRFPTEKTNLECFPILFLLSCVMHMLFSVLIPFTVKVIKQENKTNIEYSGLKNFNFGILFFYFAVLIVAIGLTILMKILIKTHVHMYLEGSFIFFMICGVIIVASWIINWRIFYYLYERE